MELTIQQQCPSCGAAIELHETDRLLQCPFCGVRNYRISHGLTRFVLPDKAPAHILRKDLFYAPYLRFKGIIFSCEGQQIQHKVIDITHLALKATGLPPTLGLRPQALKVRPVDKKTTGTFFQQSVKATAVLDMAAQLTAMESSIQNRDPLYHRAYIGETISCLYLPLYVHDNILYDAVTNSALAHSDTALDMKRKGLPFQSQWMPRFLATLCPSCGELLDGERDSLILVCYNCNSSWEEVAGRFQPLVWQRLPARQKDALYLPFWKIEVKAAIAPTGVTMETFGDFLRLTNQPLVAQPEHDRMPLCFWIPAFKIRPRIFLTLAKSMTLTQKRLSAGDTTMARGLHPVTLSRAEAAGALKTALAETAVNKRDILPILPKITFYPQATDLVYAPFINHGHDLVQEQTMHAIARSALHFSRSL
jgi:predicted RNA-binding Zn-ribbon protein involved in translation (DUF1610 family)